MDEREVIEWWVYASFAVHKDKKCRTGMHMSLGGIHDGSVKQKINIPSSTREKLVAVSDALPKMMLYRYFMESQDYIVEDAYMYQDN